MAPRQIIIVIVPSFNALPLNATLFEGHIATNISCSLHAPGIFTHPFTFNSYELLFFIEYLKYKLWNSEQWL